MDFLVKIPFAELLGMELLRFGGGEAEIALPIRDDLGNSWGVGHGGVTMSLLDVVMAHAARSPATGNPPEPSSVVTIEMKTTFMRPGLGRLLAKGRRLHRTASLAFCEGSVFDVDDAIVAHATGTFKFMTGLPAAGRRIQRVNASD